MTDDPFGPLRWWERLALLARMLRALWQETRRRRRLLISLLRGGIGARVQRVDVRTVHGASVARLELSCEMSLRLLWVSAEAVDALACCCDTRPVVLRRASDAGVVVLSFEVDGDELDVLAGDVEVLAA